MKRNILVLCTGNSARSQMAEAIINARRGDTWQAVSAGTNPASAVHPKALQAIKELGKHLLTLTLSMLTNFSINPLTWY